MLDADGATCACVNVCATLYPLNLFRLCVYILYVNLKPFARHIFHPIVQINTFLCKKNLELVTIERRKT